MASRFENGTLGDIVSNNYHAAAVFERHGLDFCCGGRSSLAEACRQGNVDLATVVAELEGLESAEVGVPSEDPAELVSHILARHHAYVRSSVPVIEAHLAKVVAAHGERHPELLQIAGHFDGLSGELTLHMAKEEQVLFPYITALADAMRSGGPLPPDVFGTVQNPIRMMEIEHQHVGDTLAAIRALSSGYAPPADACTTYRLVYEELRAFESDLHRHVHLENNVLFPRAVRLEAEGTAR
jgi:regulator of cell morphogenesis and NO signaling